MNFGDALCRDWAEEDLGIAQGEHERVKLGAYGGR